MPKVPHVASDLGNIRYLKRQLGRDGPNFKPLLLP